jgi:hypothetical protein
MPLLPRSSYLSLTPSVTLKYAFLQAPSERVESSLYAESGEPALATRRQILIMQLYRKTECSQETPILRGSISTLSPKKICTEYQSQSPGRHQLQGALGDTSYCHTPYHPLKIPSIPPGT